MSEIKNDEYVFKLKHNALSIRLWSYYLEDKYTDLIIKIGTKKFNVHRIVIENSITIFENLLFNEQINENIVEVSEDIIDCNVFEDLLKYIYTSRIVLTPDNAYQLCLTVFNCEIPELLNAIEKYLCTRINDKNVLKFYKLVDKCYLRDLEKHVLKFFSENFEIVSKQCDFLMFTYEEYIETIRRINHFKASIELKENIFNSMIYWVDYNHSERNKHLPMLLQTIPLYELSIEFLRDVVSENPYILESNDCSILVIEAFQKLSSNDYKKVVKNLKQNNSQKLLCFGGVDGNNIPSRCASIYDDNLKEIKFIKNFLNDSIYNYAADRSILYTTSKYNNSDEKSFSINCFHSKKNNDSSAQNIISLNMYDFNERKWKYLKNLPTWRKDFAMAISNNNVYICGGKNFQDATLSSLIRYNLSTNEWYSMKSMNEPRYCHQLIYLWGSLYAIGSRQSNSIEKYDIKNNKWTIMSNMENIKGHIVSATSHNNKIYVYSQDGFEVFNPGYNFWKVLPQIPNINCGLSLISFNGKLLSFGGKNLLKKEPECSVFEFDTFTEQWSQILEMSIPRMNHFTTIINL